MDTTAEKIKYVLHQLEKGSKNKSDYAEKILEFFGLGQEHRFSIFAYVHKEMDLPGYIEEHTQKDVKPADPEPLECWIWLNPSNPHAATKVYLDETAAARHRAIMEDEGWVLLELREVTPQDEQDRKDAARYRYYKSMPYRFAGADYVDFDAEIDKAMEGGDAE